MKLKWELLLVDENSLLIPRYSNLIFFETNLENLEKALLCTEWMLLEIKQKHYDSLQD